MYTYMYYNILALIVPPLSLVSDIDFPTLPNVGVDLTRAPIASLASRVDRRSRACEKQTNPSSFCSLRSIQ